MIISKSDFSQFSFFVVTLFQYKIVFLPKTKMVRMVHMKIFYGMDLDICDSKSEFGETKFPGPPAGNDVS